MKASTRALTCLPPGLFALSLLLASCGVPQDRPATRDPLPADPSTRQSVAYYQAQLAELPLRVRHYDLTGQTNRKPVAIHDMYVLHDSVRDEILIVDADRGRHTLWSIDAHDFTLHWKTPIENRVDYLPVATRNYVFLMNSDGEYQAYDRAASARQNESRLVSRGRFEGDIFPSAPPAANDSHVFVPTTNSNALRGLAMTRNARGEHADTWAFPRVGGSVSERFLQITQPPAADGETVAFVNNNHNLYLVDGQNGELRARAPLEGFTRTPPLIQDDLVFVGSDIGQVFAWQKSGESAFVVSVDGFPYGRIFVQDGYIFVRTLEVYNREVPTADGLGTRTRADLRPGKLMAFRYELVNVQNDRPVYKVIDGNPATSHKLDPIWTLPDTGQEVLMLHGNRLYVLEEQNEEFLTERELSKLKAEGRLVRKRDELRTVSRRLRVLNADTGQLLRPEWDINLIDFPFVAGSMKAHDRSIYLGTRDGYVFKAFGQTGSSAGGN